MPRGVGTGSAKGVGGGCQGKSLGQYKLQFPRGKIRKLSAGKESIVGTNKFLQNFFKFMNFFKAKF